MVILIHWSLDYVGGVCSTLKNLPCTIFDYHAKFGTQSHDVSVHTPQGICLSLISCIMFLSLDNIKNEEDNPAVVWGACRCWLFAGEVIIFFGYFCCL